MKLIFFLTLFLNLMSPAFSASIITQKAYGASILGANLCYLRQGKLTKQSFVLNVENLMLKKGYNVELLYNENVRKAGKLIANKLGSDCNNNQILQEEKFMKRIMEFLI